jgi:dTDP-4-amino-4,6-dideoxygalactose transaminase
VIRVHQTRCRYAHVYKQELSGLPKLSLPQVDRAEDDAWHLYTIQLDLDRLRITPDRFIRDTQERQVGTSVHFTPVHLHPFYRQSYGYKPDDFSERDAGF